MPAAPSCNSQEQCGKVSSGDVAAIVARGCMGRAKAECTVDFALSLVQKQHENLSAAHLEKAKRVAERVLTEVVNKEDEAGALESWAAQVEGKKVVFDDEDGATSQEEETAETNGAVHAVAGKEELHAAVKELGMGPAAYKALPKEDAAYCQELQKRILAYISKTSGEQHDTLPSEEELQELKRTVEASKELSSLDATNIIEGRPKRRAASCAAAAIKKDVERDLEREAAQAAAAEPHAKKQKTCEDDTESTNGATATKEQQDSSASTKEQSGDNDQDEEAEEDEDEEEVQEVSGGSDDSSGSDDADGSDEEGDGEDEEGGDKE